MDVKYTDYAEETLQDRKISKKKIESALSNPIMIMEGKKGRKIAHKIFGDKLLRVILKLMMQKLIK